MKKLALILLTYFIFFSSAGCVTIDHMTAPTFSDYKLCEFLTPRWISTSNERMIIVGELRKRNLTCVGAFPKRDNTRIAESPPSPQPFVQQPSVQQQVVSGGTGFLFSTKDYIITNWHVVKTKANLMNMRPLQSIGKNILEVICVNLIYG